VVGPREGVLLGGGEFGARHCPQGPIGHTCATAPRHGPLAKLLWADLLLPRIPSRFTPLAVIYSATRASSDDITDPVSSLEAREPRPSAAKQCRDEPAPADGEDGD